MFDIIPCEQAGDCQNSRVYLPVEFAQCDQCRFAQRNGGSLNCWKPRLRGQKHPQVEAEKRADKEKRNEDRHQKRLTKNRYRSNQYKKATKAEADSAQTLSAAGFFNTVNSGRKNKDGDHTAPLLRVNLDTKLQEKNIHPVVNLNELATICQQAAHVGHLGGLLLRNQNGQAVVVMTEKDFVSLAGELLQSAEEDLDNPLF